MIKFFEITIICLYISFNLVVANTMTAIDMKREYIDGQCLIGRICTNLFYLPAWMLKIIRNVFIKFIK